MGFRQSRRRAGKDSLFPVILPSHWVHLPGNRTSRCSQKAQEAFGRSVFVQGLWAVLVRKCNRWLVHLRPRASGEGEMEEGIIAVVTDSFPADPAAACVSMIAVTKGRTDCR